MSKIAIILCAVLFASAANASFISDEVHSVQQEIDSIVASAISQVRTRFESVREGASEKLKKIEAAAHDINKKLTEYVASLIQRTKDEIQRILNRGQDADVSKCSQLLEEVDKISVDIYSKMSDCVVGKIHTGVSYVDKMEKTADDVIGNLNALRDEGQQCGNSVNNTRTALRAVFCIKLVVAKAAWTAAKAVPSVTYNLGRLSLLLGTLQPSLVYCSKSQAFTVLMAQSANIVRKTRKCVQETIAEKIGKKPTTLPGVPDKKPGDDSTVVTTASPSSSSESGDSTETTPNSGSNGDDASTTDSTTSAASSSQAPSSSQDPSSSQAPSSTEAAPSTTVKYESDDNSSTASAP